MELLSIDVIVYLATASPCTDMPREPGSPVLGSHLRVRRARVTQTKGPGPNDVL